MAAPLLCFVQQQKKDAVHKSRSVPVKLFASKRKKGDVLIFTGHSYEVSRDELSSGALLFV